MQKRKIIYRNPADLRAYENNSRAHTDEQIELLAASITEFGFNNPILLKDDEATIGAGHARCLAAIKCGLSEVPTITLHGLSDAQWRAYVITDNQLAIRGSSWDEEMLVAELRAIGEAGFDVATIGFSDEEMADLLRTINPSTDPDEIPPVPETPVSVLGDIWIMGDHRIACGSSTDPDVVTAVLAGGEAILESSGETFEAVAKLRLPEAALQE